MKASKGHSQPEMVAAAFPILYMVRGSPFLYQVLIVTHLAWKVGAEASSIISIAVPTIGCIHPQVLSSLKNALVSLLF